MLVLTRRAGQAIRVGLNVEVRVVRIEGDRVVLGIAAPRHVAVVRSELIEEVSGEVRQAADARATLRIMLKPMHALDRPAPEGPSSDDPGVA
jgi:carbon storage regulator